jgi:hypothetical protein
MSTRKRRYRSESRPAKAELTQKRILIFFGTDTVAFSATSPSSGTTRSFTSFSQALNEAIDSRVWGGIHWRIADVQGAQLGMEVARREDTHYFKPTSGRGADRSSPKAGSR